MDREEGEGEKERGGGREVVKVGGGGVGGRRRMGEERKDWRRGAHGVVLTGWPWPGQRAGGPFGPSGRRTHRSSLATAGVKSHPPTHHLHLHLPAHTPHSSVSLGSPSSSRSSSSSSSGSQRSSTGPSDTRSQSAAPRSQPAPACRTNTTSVRASGAGALRQCTAEKTPVPSRLPPSRVKALGGFPGPGPCAGGDAHAASSPLWATTVHYPYTYRR